MLPMSEKWANPAIVPDFKAPTLQNDHDRLLETWVPDLDNLDPQLFAMGLQATPAEFDKAETLVKDAFYKGRIDGLESLNEAGESFRETIDDVVDDLLNLFPVAKKDWTHEWVQAIFQVMWRNEQQRLLLETKQSNFGESSSYSCNPGGTKGQQQANQTLPPLALDDPNIMPVPLASPKLTSAASIQQTKYHTTLEQTIMSLEGFTNDRKFLFAKEEIVSARCVHGNASNQVKEYLLLLFIKEFEESLNEGREKTINLLHGSLGYLDSKGNFKKIQRQSHFEVAINHLYNGRTDDILSFYFYEESPEEMEHRIAAEKAQKRLFASNSKKLTPSQPLLASVKSNQFQSPAPSSSKLNEQRIIKPRELRVAFPSPGISAKRSSILGRGMQILLPKKELISEIDEFRAATFKPQPAIPHRLSPPPTSNAVASSIKQVLRIKPQPASKIPKLDFYEGYIRRFKSLYEVARIDTYKKGDTDDLNKEGINLDDTANHIQEFEVDDDEEEEEQEPQEYMVNTLQKILNDFDMTNLHTHGPNSEWERCCSLFQIDSSKTGMEHTVDLFGLKTPLYQYQAFAVYWQMAKSRLFGGGFVGDDPGLGKTLTYLAYIVAERQLSWLWKDVADSRVKNDGRHLQSTGQEPEDECPSKKEFRDWIACPCRATNPTSRMRPKPGVRLAVVPDNLVEPWRKAFVQYVSTDKPLEMKVVIAHPASNLPRNPGFSVIDSRHRANDNCLKAMRTPLDRKFKHDDDKPQANQERCLVITTAHYYKTWAKEFEYKAIVKSYDKSGAEVWVDGRNPGIVFGIAMIDECHEESQWQRGKGRSGVLADLPKLNQPILWGYSGTPFSISPRALEGVLWALECHYPKRDMMSKKTGWEENQNFEQFSHKRFDKLCGDFQALNKPIERPDAQFRSNASQVFILFKHFLRSFMLRRTAETSWFGRPLLALKPHYHRDIILKGTNNYVELMCQIRDVVEVELLEKLEEIQALWQEKDEQYKATHPMPERLTFNTERRVQWRLRLMATFPYLVRLAAIENKDHLNLTTAEFVTLIGAKERSSPYFTYLKFIVESSPKAMWLHGFINALMTRNDVDGMEQKLVVVTNFNPVALILKLFIEKFVKGAAGRVGAIYAGVKQRERNAILEAFTDAVDEKGVRKQKHNFKFLIGTTRFISSGLQLTRACHIVLMEPDFQFAHEVQTYARIHRIGQRNPQSFSYRLTIQDDQIEREILNRQAIRNEFPGRSYMPSVETMFPDSEVEVRGFDENEKLAEEDRLGIQPHTMKTSRSGSRSTSRGRSTKREPKVKIPESMYHPSRHESNIPTSRSQAGRAQVLAKAGPSAKTVETAENPIVYRPTPGQRGNLGEKIRPHIPPRSSSLNRPSYQTEVPRLQVPRYGRGGSIIRGGLGKKGEYSRNPPPYRPLVGFGARQPGTESGTPSRRIPQRQITTLASLNGEDGDEYPDTISHPKTKTSHNPFSNSGSSSNLSENSSERSNSVDSATGCMTGIGLENARKAALQNNQSLVRTMGWDEPGPRSSKASMDASELSSMRSSKEPPVRGFRTSSSDVLPPEDLPRIVNNTHYEEARAAKAAKFPATPVRSKPPSAPLPLSSVPSGASRTTPSRHGNSTYSPLFTPTPAPTNNARRARVEEIDEKLENEVNTSSLRPKFTTPLRKTPISSGTTSPTGPRDYQTPAGGAEDIDTIHAVIKEWPLKVGEPTELIAARTPSQPSPQTLRRKPNLTPRNETGYHSSSERSSGSESWEGSRDRLEDQERPGDEEIERDGSYSEEDSRGRAQDRDGEEDDDLDVANLERWSDL